MQEFDRFLLAQARGRVFFDPRRFNRLDVAHIFPRNEAALAELLIRATQNRERPGHRGRRLAGRQESRLIQPQVIAGHVQRIDAARLHLKDKCGQVRGIRPPAVRRGEPITDPRKQGACGTMIPDFCHGQQT